MRLIAGVAAAALLLTSCGSEGGPADTPRPSSAASASGSATPALTTGLPPPSVATTPGGTPPSTQPTTYASAPHTVPAKIGYPDNGSVVTLHVGAAVRVELDSTYWTIRGSSDVSVLAPAGPAVHTGQSASSSCPPGVGCGAVAQTFTALRPGRAIVSAHRTVCGEAMACLPAQENFRVTVAVD